MKKRLLSGELSWKVLQELRKTKGIPRNISLAVVADQLDGWRVVVAIHNRRHLSAEAAKQIAAVEQRLRMEYQLIS